MSATIYDVCLLNKLKKWIKDDKLKITGVDETRRLFEYIADVTNDKPIELPLITLRRSSTMNILSTAKKPLTFDGWRKNNTGERGDQLNAIPIQLNYQIDIYTRYLEEAEEYVRNFVFNIINYPKLTIEIPYNNSRILHDCNIRLETEISDNSDIPERFVAGQFTRKTISIYIDDAYLFDYRTKDTLKIEGDVEVTIEPKVLLIDDLKDKK